MYLVSSGNTNHTIQLLCSWRIWKKITWPSLRRLITLSPSNRYHPPTLLAHTRTHGFPAQKLALFRPSTTTSCGTNHRAALWSHDIFLANDWLISVSANSRLEIVFCGPLIGFLQWRQTIRKAARTKHFRLWGGFEDTCTTTTIVFRYKMASFDFILPQW